MAKQLHKRFATNQIKALLKKHEAREIELSSLLNILGISKRSFLKYLKATEKTKITFQLITKEIIPITK